MEGERRELGRSEGGRSEGVEWKVRGESWGGVRGGGVKVGEVGGG